MKLLSALLLLLAIAPGVFAWWGLYTPAGRSKYDEMDGLYPLGAGVLAIVLLFAAIIMFGIGRFLARTA